MDRKGLIGKVSLISLIFLAIVITTLFSILGYSAPNYVNYGLNFSNGTNYSTSNVYSFNSTWINTTTPEENVSWVTAATNFTLGRPDGTIRVYNSTTIPALTNNTTTLPVMLQIIFTQDQLGPVGVYNYSFGINTTNGTNWWTNVTPVTVFTITQGANSVILNMSNSSGNFSNQNVTLFVGQNSTIAATTSVGSVEIWNTTSSVMGPSPPPISFSRSYMSVGAYGYKANTTGNENYSANDTGFYYLNVYGFANLSCPFGNYKHLLSRAGGTYTVECLVQDNVTGSPVGNYTVNIYNDTTLMASNTTNSTGWATITFSTPTEASYTLVANISDDTSIFYYKTYPFSTDSIMFVANQYNPRPFVLTNTSVVTVTHIPGGWGQLEPNYSFPLPFVVPNFSGGTFNGMILPSNIYAPLSYQSEMFFKPPTRMEMFAYNFTFNITYSSSGPQIINISTAMPELPPDQLGFYKNQTVLPAKFVTFQLPEFMKFDNLSEAYTPPNMTILMKNPDDFSINITNGTYTWIINGSQRYNITNMPAPNATFDRGKVVINFTGTANQNYTVSLIFGTQDISCFDQFPGGPQNFSDYNFRKYCERHAGDDPNAPPIGPPKTESTPVLITYQNISGFNLFATDPGEAPPVNTTLTTSFIFNLTNPLLNYTGDKLYAEFRYPLNITEWNGTWYTSNPGNTSFNISENHQIYWWNETSGSWLQLSSTTTPYINISDGCTNMTDEMPGSPMYGKNMTMCFRAMLFNLNQTVPGDTNRLEYGWVYGADVRLNVTVSNSFKIISQTTATNGTTMGEPGSFNWFNATVAGGQSAGGSTGGTSVAQSTTGLFTFNDTILPNISQACVAGLSASQCNNITVFVNGQPYYNWTTGSVILTSQSSGAQIISISYTVPSVAAEPTVTTTGAGGLGGAVVARPYIKLAVGKVNITMTSLTPSGKMIADIARYKDLAIRQLNITVVNNVANIKIMITKLPGLPATVSHEIIGKVYHYINIEKINITDIDINKTFIKFAVNKTWLTDNNVDPLNITLYRWADNKWNDLGATKVDEDEREVFYSAEFSGLSIFAIGTKGGIPPTPTVPVTCTENWSCTEWSECVEGTQTRTCTDLNNCGTTVNKPAESQSCIVEAEVVGFPIWSTVAIIIVIIVVVVLLYIQRDKIKSYFKKTKTQYIYKKPK